MSLPSVRLSQNFLFFKTINHPFEECWSGISYDGHQVEFVWCSSWLHWGCVVGKTPTEVKCPHTSCQGSLTSASVLRLTLTQGTWGPLGWSTGKLPCFPFQTQRSWVCGFIEALNFKNLQHLYPFFLFIYLSIFEASKDICTRVLRLASHSSGGKLGSTHLLEETVTTQDSSLLFGVLQ